MTEPILIVGAGPTGLTAALELSRFGIPVRLIDERDAPADTSRAIGIQARTLELMEQRGLAEEIVRLGNPGHYGSVYGGGKRVFRLDFGQIDSRYNYLLFLSQAETERILREAIAARGIEPEWQVEMVSFSQDTLSHDDSKITATLRRKDGGYEEVRTPWLISGEGAHSKVRSTLDLQFEGKALAEQYALGDLHVDGDLADTDFHIFSSEHGFMGLFPMGEGHFRLIASNPDGDPHRGSPPTEAELQRVYDERSPVPARFRDTTWTSWFRINSRMVHKLKVGRLLLGGDSAHIHSPAGAQGMNTGIQDMINLCWKLALVVEGKAPEALLDTYEQDRLPVMHDVLFKTENLTEIIGEENHIVRMLFNHLGPWIGSNPHVQQGSTRNMAQLALGYEDGPLSVNHHHSGSLKAGQRIPEMTARYRGSDWSAARVLTLLDPSGFTAIVAHGNGAGVLDPDLIATIAAADVPITTVELAPALGVSESEYRGLFGHDSNVFFVRPDGYVAIASNGRAAPAALHDWLETWLTPDGAA